MSTATQPGPGAEWAARSPRRRWTVIVLVLVLVFGATATRVWWPRHNADIRAGTALVDAQGMAARYGIKLSLLAVTAAGGMIELRYQVTDPDKADRLIHDRSLSPVLVDEATGATLIMASPPHHHGAELELGASYFFLIANARNALHRGSKVTLVIGDARLEHIEAQR